MKTLLLFLTLFFAQPASAIMVEVCVSGDPVCSLVTYTGREVIIQTPLAIFKAQPAEFANSIMRERALDGAFKVVYITKQQYDLNKAAIKPESYNTTREALKSNLDMSREDARKLISCGLTAAACGGSVASIVLTNWAGVALSIATCGSSALTCNEAIESLDEYIERVRLTKQLLDEQESEVRAELGYPPRTSGSPSTRSSGGGGGDPRPGMGGSGERGGRGPQIVMKCHFEQFGIDGKFGPKTKVCVPTLK